ncbi:serine palmitoyltransferase 2-like [Oppia nitens]|uniref:serine palmitoyltransferase 2-like n=1 Tax=Oppia nitens TaxID=1686743 RepID=UPI0023DB828A|nr:serine palmitoyltransferase 2-like [Oppia nitens]
MRQETDHRNGTSSLSWPTTTTTMTTTMDTGLDNKPKAAVIANGQHLTNGYHLSSGTAIRSQQQSTASIADKVSIGDKGRTVNSKGRHINEDAPFHIVLLCYFSYVVLIMFGYLRDFLRQSGLERNPAAVESNRDGYVKLYQSFESFYTRNIYRRICDSWNKPICSVPGSTITIIDRNTDNYNWTFTYPGTTTTAINMGSYNYLGFAETSGPIHRKVGECLDHYGVAQCSTRQELGTTDVVQRLEEQTARYLGVEDCVIFGMGFATNATNIQTIAGKGSLILSDELNHASIILGARLTGSTVRTFRHNNMADLERKIRGYIVAGQPRTHRPWKRILILTEGIYSMEGSIVDLPELIRIKKKYNCYVYLDEAHSIGAIGPNGKGVCDYYGCDPNDIDLLMGTFTKSFGAAGGYIAGKKSAIDYIRTHSYGDCYANAISPVIATQISGVMSCLMGEDGTDDGEKRIKQLARNTQYFRQKLNQLGFIIYGNNDSPVVPLMLCFCPKIPAVIRLAYKKRLGFIGAGFPATSLTSGRVRFCVSASHTKEMLDKALEVMDEIGDKLEIKYSSRPLNKSEIIY